MNRFIDSDLHSWSMEAGHKPLILRGARQVGKTFSVRALGQSFPHFAEVNFEETPDVRLFFSEALTAAPICEKLAAFTGVPIRPGKTLLFLDEAQACPQALAALRYFHEQIPGLHVIAAGSLLEFALQQIPSLGVGRVTSRFMHPMTFSEFLEAVGDGTLRQVIDDASCDKPVDVPFHRRLVDRLRTYLLIGGMPAAVSAYVQTHDLHHVMVVLDDLLLTFQDDFAKYRHRTPVQRLNETFRSVAVQAGGKFVCASVNREVKSTAILDTLSLLMNAGLAHQVVHTHARGLPLGAQTDSRRFKAMLFDSGIHQRLLGLDLAAHLTESDTTLVNGGSLAEIFVGLHLIAHQPAHRRPELFYWHRENRGANAEVDYVIQLANTVCPVEVKAGTRGGMQSLRVFLHERALRLGVRLSLENFSRIQDALIIPLYATHRLCDGTLPL